MQRARFIDEAARELSERHHAEAGLIAYKDDVPRELRQGLE